MKIIRLIQFVFLIITFSFVPHSESVASDSQELSKLLKKGSAEGVKLEKSEKEKLEKLLLTVLPDKNFIGEEREWKVVYHDTEKEGDFFQVDLKEKNENSFDHLMWFHILYKPEKPKFYGSEDFGDYRGMGMKDVHYFILVGNMEIRAVASAEDFKNDTMIKGVLKAFKLKEIEKL